jgi:hypothetical protein
MIDALLIAHQTFIVKGRSVGKTAFMKQAAAQHPFSANAQKSVTFSKPTVTFADLQDAYDRAMKSNSNLYPVPTHKVLIRPTASVANVRSALDILIQKEILPAIVAEYKDADLYSWIWQGFHNTIRGATGRVMVKANLNVYYRNFTIDRSFMDKALASKYLDYLVNTIEDQLRGTVRDLLSDIVPPHDINTCKDPECNC